MPTLIDELKELLGAGGVLEAAAVSERASSYWDSSPMQAKALVRPASTAEVSAVLRACHRRGQSVVVLGGLTGPVEGALTTCDDVAMSLERMNRIESVDAMDGVAVIEAGAVLQTVQEALESKGFLFPLDLGARGSCTIGGTIATNAGGINVLRYGMMRNLVVGLEAVLADGTIVSSMQPMLKNNTGYDLKQLFIGSEGTLGVVTRAIVRLFPMPKSRQTAMLAVDSFDAVTRVLSTVRSELGGTLSAFEVMWNNYYRAVTVDGGPEPVLDYDHAFYVLVEAEGADPDTDAERFAAVLERCFDEGSVVDAVLPKSEAERDALWRIREDFDAALPAYMYDVSLPIRAMDDYVTRLDEALGHWRSDADGLVFGHIADGNLHIFVRPHDDGVHHERADECVYRSLEGFGGSVSAEHGIGIEKKAWLPVSRSAEELDLMRSLKRMLDPYNILNPGKVLD